MAAATQFIHLRGMACLLLALAAPAEAAAGAAARGAAAVPDAAPATREETVASGEDPGDPATVCYRQALTRGSAAYDCDLAVQMARDAGGDAALAAALNNRALVLAGDGRLEPALEDLETAIRLAPDAADVQANLGNLLLRLGRPADALAAYDRAVALAPRDAASYFNRAFGYLALGEQAAASQDVEHARSLLGGSGLREQSAPGPDGPPAR